MFFILGLFLSTAFYGVLSLVLYLLLFKPEFAQMLTIALNPNGMPDWFIAFMIWSVPAFIVLSILHLLLCKIDDRANGLGVKTQISLRTICTWLLRDITNPFRGLFSFVGARKTIDSKGWWFIHDWGEVILHFVWAVSLIVWIAYGFISLF